jgi:hypothetical protein
MAESLRQSCKAPRKKRQNAALTLTLTLTPAPALALALALTPALALALALTLTPAPRIFQKKITRTHCAVRGWLTKNPILIGHLSDERGAASAPEEKARITYGKRRRVDPLS